jgi:hypothetical protein
VGCATACCRSTIVVSGTAAANCPATVTVIGYAARSAVVASTAFTTEAVPAPAVTIAPAPPGSHAQEDAVIEVAGAVITHRRAGVRLVSIVPVGTYRLSADIDHDLSLYCWCQGKACEQYRRTEESLESTHQLPP